MGFIVSVVMGFAVALIARVSIPSCDRSTPRAVMLLGIVGALMGGLLGGLLGATPFMALHPVGVAGSVFGAFVAISIGTSAQKAASVSQ